MSQDAHLAWKIHNQMNRFDVTGITENAIFPNDSKENYKPKTLIDTTLETIDPTPNIHTLFVQFNKKFFSNKLLSVEVKWSQRMTSCAGTCSFNTGNRYCVIALSSPLLKLRPRKDLVETLLHEMIHAYLFVTNNNRDRDGHGPEFCKHMHRINKEAGTNITIYHTFHAEVKLYQQHWWRCNGPCQKRHPFFGMVRRAMNRAPGPNDFWWSDHQTNCGGQFIKVREPEKPDKKGKKAPKNNSQNPSLDKWLTTSKDKSKGQTGSSNSQKPPGKLGSNNFHKPKDKIGTGNKNGGNNSFKTGAVGVKTKGGSSVVTVNKWNAKKNPTEPGVAKIGNGTNNVHGFGTGGPGSSSSSSSTSKVTTSSAKPVSFTGTLGGSGSGQSRLLQMFGSSISSQSNSKETDGNEREKPKNQSHSSTVKCPICQDIISEKIANEHIDSCLSDKEKKKPPFMNSTPKFASDGNSGKNTSSCPVCNKEIPISQITKHVDECLANSDANSPPSGKLSQNSPESNSSISNSFPLIEINDTDSDSDIIPNKKRKISDFFKTEEKNSPKNKDKAKCPVCKKDVNIDEMNRHLDDCLAEIGDVDMNEAGPSSQVANKDTKDSEIEFVSNGNETEPKKCFICNKILDPEVSFTQHLDDCLNGVVNENRNDYKIKEDTEKKFSRNKNAENNEKKAKPEKSLVNGNAKNGTKPEKSLINGNAGNETRAKKCSVCNEMIDPSTSFMQHFEDCVKDLLDGNAFDDWEIDDKNKEDTANKNTKDERNRRKEKKPEECSTCKKMVDPENSSTHWKNCVKNSIDDSGNQSSSTQESPSFIKTSELIKIDDSSSSEDDSNGKEKSHRFPCPVCLTLVPQSEMNKHLDSCLG